MSQTNQHRRFLRICSGVAGLVVLAATSSPAADVDFEQDVRPLFQKHCIACHGPDDQKSGLRLDAKSLAFKGGDGGAVIAAGKSSESQLIVRITSNDPDLRMPPDGGALSESETNILRNWIDQGAEWKETDYDTNAAIDSRLDHWAWHASEDVQIPELPSTMNNDGRLFNGIDKFVAAKLSEHELTFSPEADRRTLIRRLSFDLLGLPPTPEQVAAFVNDDSPQAYESLVDQFLASPHYGERWARHWLDIAHYADTHGFERDQRRDNAWRYRDWVIRAFNDDMPYDKFLQDQIAGDVLRPDDANAVAATGFLAAGPWDFVGQAETPSPVLKRLARADDLDDMITQVMTSACAVTINCARCHDHKLDPISQREYYSVVSVFAGIKRGDRLLSTREQADFSAKKNRLEKELADARNQLAMIRRDGWSLSDIVGGGDGHGSGNIGQAIDTAPGKSTSLKRGFLENASANVFTKSDLKFVDGVVIPDGGNPTTGGPGEVVVTSTGLKAQGIANTSGRAWDAIRNGPVNSQFSTSLDGIDFATDDHSLLSLHANAAITFDLEAMRASGMPIEVNLRAQAGYFGQTPKAGASFAVYLDARPIVERTAIGRDDGLIEIIAEIPSSVRFLTLMATDHGNDISHDQICFANARLEPRDSDTNDPDAALVTELTKTVNRLKQELADLREPARIYAALAETPPAVHVQLRGNPEQTGDEVRPGVIACVSTIEAEFGDSTLSDAQRRIAITNWITSANNPLTRRVIVNRLWQHHFGVGLVDTPSDFGRGGSLPSHPELLDWLAARLLRDAWSLKKIHRLICLSATYRQSSGVSPENDPNLDTGRMTKAMQTDSGNRLLWRQNARRLDAESLRDAVLTVSGKLNKEMYGPGYRDFDYKEEYAPVYTYVTTDKPELWRRSIYRFIVRTTPDQFLATLDCPNAANLTPTRNTTTTALQALALMNNDFMLRQAKYLADRVELNAAASRPEQIDRLFSLAFGRKPTETEQVAAQKLFQKSNLTELCRAVLNSNEFVYID